MATELYWPRRSTFVELAGEGDDDEERRFVGPGTFEVPDSMVDQYLERGWERPDADASTSDQNQEPTEVEGSEAAEEADAAETMVPDQDQAAEPEAEAASEGFDAGAFVDRTWQEVTGDIENGAADEHLDAVESAEQDRESGPRDSVIQAIEARR